MKISADSPMVIPLVRQALTDKQFKIRLRAMSKEWNYEGVIRWIVSGFNPLWSSAFVPAESTLARWLKAPEKSGRKFNFHNHLIYEVLFLVHDYLHSWAYLAINELNPKLGFGTKPITESNFEDFVFCHLVTEAIAVAGLDYWYLSVIDLGKVCPMGTEFTTMTVDYHERWLNEYRRFNPKLAVQKPAFLRTLSKFYCDGSFPGFDEKDYEKSRLIEKWLEHELLNGDVQRAYSRQWLHHLRSADFELDQKKLLKPVSCSKRWQKDLTNQLSELLWEKVKDDKLHRFSFKFDPSRIWKARYNDHYDFRFTNLNTLDEAEAVEKMMAGPNLDENFKFFFYQYVSGYDCSSFDREIIKLFDVLQQKKDFQLIKRLFKDQKKVAETSREPRDLFFLN